MQTFKHLINGQLVTSDTTFAVLNPATEQLVAECPAASDTQLNDAFHAAQHAHKDWQATDVATRRGIIKKIAARIEQNRDQLAALLTMEQGKPVAQSQAEIDFCLSHLAHIESVDWPFTMVLRDDDEQRVEVYQKPFGVVAAIAPWNFPFHIGAAKVTMPILLGNTVVLKPSPHTPLTTLMLAELIADVVPAGVVNIIAGDDALGAKMTSHPIPRKILFTGSVPTGRKIAHSAAEDFKRITLELGGNDAAIVLPNTDLDRFAESIFWATFRNCGQICVATKRLFVHKAQIELLAQKLATIANSINVGNGMDAGVEMGPLNNKQQLDIVHNLVEDAKKTGAKIWSGGEKIPGAGYFYQPTIITNVQEGVAIVDQEQFGPALPLLSYETVEEAVERANATHLGLSGRVWGNDYQQALAVAKQIESGSVNINNASGCLNGPFGGVKSSGVGRERGIWGFYGLTEPQTINIDKR